MKLVIDIEEAIYKECIPYKDTPIIANLANYNSEIIHAIANGTPLPEHHGRLGDLDALEEYFGNVRKELKASDYKNGIEFFVRDEMLLNFQQFIHLCDAIIEGSDSE